MWLAYKKVERVIRYTVKTPDQFSALIAGFRAQAELSQQQVALRLGISQQAYSALERNASNVGAERLLKLLNILGVDLSLSKTVKFVPSQPGVPSDKPIW